MTVEPDTATFASVAAIVSNTELSDVFLIVMFFPDAAAIVSLNVSTMLAVCDTPVESSAGEAETSVGATTSARTVKLKFVEVAIPA